ncbi:hypothetical protein A2U01_0006484, partial [Trifolium medium]|nr:hypothetical protein [Trifolium medium]
YISSLCLKLFTTTTSNTFISLEEQSGLPVQKMSLVNECSKCIGQG